MHNIIIAGDTHLKPLIWTRRPEVANDAFLSFEQILQYCKEYSAGLILAGDVFDNTRPDQKSVDALLSIFDYDIPLVYFIQGQHDKVDPPWLTALTPSKYADRIIHINERTFTPFNNGVTWYGLDYEGNIETLKSKLEAIPKNVDTLVCHQLLDITVPFNPSMLYQDIPAHIKRLFMGDLHEPVALKKDDKEIFYTGSAYFCREGEPKDKYCLLVDSTNKVTKLPLKTRNFVTITLNNQEEASKVYESLDNMDIDTSFLPPVITVVYNAVDGALTEITEKIIKVLTEKGAISYAVPTVMRAETNTITDLNAISSTVSIQDILLKYVEKDSTEYMIINELMNTDNYSEVFDQWRKSIIKN